MESNDELKEIDIKNRMCYNFDDTIIIADFDFDNILFNEKSYVNILTYEITYKLLHIRFDKFIDLLEFLLEIVFFWH